MEIKVRYHADIDEIEKIKVGDWLDLRSAETVDLIKGEFYMINLGVSIQLPKGYEAMLIPRSSLFKKKGLIQANSVGLIDESYCGDNDIWMLPVYATRNTQIIKNERICQFRVQKKMQSIEIKVVDFLENKDRGGFGSTGDN